MRRLEARGPVADELQHLGRKQADRAGRQPVRTIIVLLILSDRLIVSAKDERRAVDEKDVVAGSDRTRGLDHDQKHRRCGRRAPSPLRFAQGRLFQTPRLARLLRARGWPALRALFDRRISSAPFIGGSCWAAHFFTPASLDESASGRRARRMGKMRFGKGLAASAVAMAIAVGSDSELRSAQSFTIPTACTDAAECAAFCRSAVEQGRTEGDFIALASYQLGPERPIDMPPANVSMPAPVDPHNVYARAGAGMFRRAVAGHLSRVYSPTLLTGRVDVIDPETFRVIDSLTAIPSAEHIVPSWDLQTLWVSGDISYRGGHADVVPIDPKTGKLGKAIDVPDSYNLYFTPDGKSAIVVAEAMRRLEFRDPHR